MAQLGARFHGMEEVIGSIPIRSTKYLLCKEFGEALVGRPRSRQANDYRQLRRAHPAPPSELRTHACRGLPHDQLWRHNDLLHRTDRRCLYFFKHLRRRKQAHGV